MTNLPNETAVLALRRERDIAIYQRFFDTSTSGWRYRCSGTFSSADNSYEDYTALRKNNPDKVKAAVDRLNQLEGTGLSMAHCDGFGSLGPDDHHLLFLADLQRFLSVNSLIVAKHFRGTTQGEVDFKRFAPIYNLIVALDLCEFAEIALEKELATLMRVANAPGFRDDQYANASGTLRALADMLARKPDDARQLETLELSQKLNANPGKAARIVRLMRKHGRKKEAQVVLQNALLKWPEAKPITSLAASRH